MTWESALFSELAEFRNGLNFVKTDNGKSVKIIGVSDFQDHIELESLNNLEEIRVKGELRHEDMLQNDDLLFVRSNGNKELIGRCIIIDVGNHEVSYSGFTIRARLKSNRVLARFLVQLFRTIYIKRQIQTVGGGTNISNLSQRILSNLIIPIPALPEQFKIVEILSTWDKAIAILEQLINAKLKLKQGLMQQLLTGKKRFKEFEALGDKWKTTSFNQIIDKCFDYRGRTPLKIGMEWGNGKIPALSASNVRMGKIDFDRECYLGSNELYKKWMTQGNVEKGDVLLTTEAPLGNVAQIPDNELYILSQRVILIRPKTNLLDKSFLFHLMTSQEFQGELDRNSSGSTAKGIQRKRLEKIVIAIPSLKEQHKIASILSTADAEISNLEKQLAAYKQQKRGLMQQLLTGKKRVKIEADATV